MREIKFRAWDKKEENMVFHEQLMNQEWNLLRPMAQPKTSNWVMLQYTGLKDKNGKEIYEGDIIRHDSAGVGVVEYDNDNYSFQMNISSAVLDQECSPEGKKMEIIGNIYENPEILEERS